MFGRGESVEAQPGAQAAPSVAPVPDKGHETQAGESTIGRLRPSLASLMVEEGVATSEQLEQALAEGQQNGERLGEVVLRHGWINEAGLAGLVARQWDLSFVALSAITVDDSARALLSREVCERLSACPVSFDDGVPVLALADPNEDRFAAVREALGTHCSFFVTTGSALAGLIDQQPSASPDVDAVRVVETPTVSEHVDEAPVPEAPPALALAPAGADTETEDHSAPVVDQLDQLLERLLGERERSLEELAGCQRQLADYQRQLADLEDQQARVRESIRSLEAKLGDEEKRLESMRARLTEYAQSFSQH
jgi:flagellar motility protein MotE (MotC chaperone)